jgi:hypothetical protein
MARRVDLLTFEIGSSEVLRIHGCSRCGGVPDPERFTKHLITALKELVP